ncbi:polymorphic toxin-type HINT domain-containing protein [Amycolatopsis methanolica]|uniref:polymorphic toxin-type HINT domain-containing protein n=1 Tax=Amycolatopsis methanolica TaxID=1814 RepID=UPI0034387B5F
MADGSTKPIAALKLGDEITNAEPDDPNTQKHVVTAIHITDDDRDFATVTIATPNGPKDIVTTAHHLFWDTTTHAWTEAAALKPAEQLDTPGDGHVAVLAVRVYTGTLQTYNLTIDTVHTYYVLAGTAPVLVHNSGPCDPLSLASKINPDDLAMTQTVASHFDEMSKAGKPARPYMNSSLVVREIMEGSAPKLDPQGVAGVVRWDTPGAYNGSSGRWELVVNTDTNTIIHFNFVR